MQTHTKNLEATISILQAEKEALEKKLAEQQTVTRMAIDAQRYRFLRDENNWGEDSAPNSWEILGESNGSEFDAIVDAKVAENGIVFGIDQCLELTKREAAARQQGFEEGKQTVLGSEYLRDLLTASKQAGRDEVLKGAKLIHTVTGYSQTALGLECKVGTNLYSLPLVTKE